MAIPDTREAHNPYLLSPEENHAIFIDTILPTRYEGLLSVANPVVYFFGGQMTTVRNIRLMKR